MRVQTTERSSDISRTTTTSARHQRWLSKLPFLEESRPELFSRVVLFSKFQPLLKDQRKDDDALRSAREERPPREEEEEELARLRSRKSPKSQKPNPDAEREGNPGNQEQVPGLENRKRSPNDQDQDAGLLPREEFPGGDQRQDQSPDDDAVKCLHDNNHELLT